ncbi:MAG TPA: prolyl aminopeptidase [Candidatus Saccharimonadales bacterium]|nr:prolyl aminopeptidase [Candidatus Saccharimonadales bacterium]
MREPYPFYASHQTGMLPVGDGHEVYFEVSGNPAGRPVVDLHGGPGGGISPNRRRLFDPAVWRLIQFDQRGCGRSTPHAGGAATDLSTNTTHHLIADIERLRAHLGVERWAVWGGSWGVTLGLAYAERHPERVTGMILVSIALTRRSDVRWFGHEAGRFFPEEWERFRRGVPEAERGDLVAAYDRLLNHQPDPAVREPAAADWAAWEDAIYSLDPAYVVPNPKWEDRRYRMAFARLVTHYFSHAAWLEEEELLGNAARLAGIPAVLVHGRMDISCPADAPWQLARAWPGAELHFVREGHTGGEQMADALLEAVHTLARD